MTMISDHWSELVDPRVREAFFLQEAAALGFTVAPKGV